MTKFFIFLALIWLVYSYLKNVSRAKPAEPKHTHNSAQKQAEDIVPCAHCGLHIPKNESILANKQYFCNDAHRRAFLK